MNRKIKFRGYNLKNKKWIYGNYFMNRGKHFVVEDEIAEPQKTWEDFEVDSESVGQYVGKNDNEGNEIYEGSLIRMVRPKCPDKFPVLWSDDLGRFMPSFIYDDYTRVKVVGNEYEEKIKGTQSSL